MVAYVRFENCIFTSNLISMHIFPTVCKKLMDFRCISEAAAAAALHRGGFWLASFQVTFRFRRRMKIQPNAIPVNQGVKLALNELSRFSLGSRRHTMATDPRLHPQKFRSVDTIKIFNEIITVLIASPGLIPVVISQPESYKITVCHRHQLHPLVKHKGKLKSLPVLPDQAEQSILLLMFTVNVFNFASAADLFDAVLFIFKTQSSTKSLN